MLGARNHTTIWLATGVIALISVPSWADVPRLVSYQGRVTQNGHPVDGTVVLEFRLYDAPVGGTQTWAEIHPSVTVNNGLFTVLLGSQQAGGLTDDALSASTIWLGVRVGGGDELTPRTQLVMVPYAAKSKSAEQLVRPDSFARVISVDTNGQVGINTSTPNAALELRAGANPSAMRVYGPGGNQALEVGVGGGVHQFSLSRISDAFTWTANETTPGFPSHTMTLHQQSGASTYHQASFGVNGSGVPYVAFGPESGSLVGIGTASPQSRLDVYDGKVFVRGTGNTGIQVFGRTHTANSLFIEGEGNASGYFDLGAWGAATGWNDPDAKLRIDANVVAIQSRSSLSVGIGTDTPQAKLDVAGTARVDALEIDAGADISEPFHISNCENGGIAGASPLRPQPGMVVCIDPDNPGKLRVSTTAYDRTVVGVISGAGGVKPGLLLRQAGTAADGAFPVALTGRVYVLCDADTGGPITPGDFLTTSDTPGYAMRAEPAHATGTVLGKAMTGLDGGRALVLVLVGLQ